MRSLLIAALLLLSVESGFSQTGFPNYYKFFAIAHQGDSLYAAKSYAKAAQSYLAAIAVPVENGLPVPVDEMYYNAACCFSLCGKKNDAFNCLNTLATTFLFNDIDRLLADTDLNTLHSDKRWKRITETIASNKTKFDNQQALYKKRTTLASDSSSVIFYPLTPFAKKYVEQDSFPFISVNYGHFRIYFSADSYAAQHLDDIKAGLDEAYYRAINILNIDVYNRGINIVLYNSVEELKAMTGVRVQGGIAYAPDDIAFFPYTNKRRPQFKHEIFHIISLNMWGQSYSRLLIEGAAVYADNECYFDNPIYSINAYLLKNNKLFSVQSLVDNFDQKAIESDVIAYLQSAAIFKYLYERYGVDKLKLLWVQGFGSFETIYGFSIAQLEKEWLDFIKTIPAPAQLDEKKLLTEGCG